MPASVVISMAEKEKLESPNEEPAREKKKVGRREARKVRDKWKAKQWYTIRAPKVFNLVPIAETLSDEAPKLMDRIAETTLQELTGDFSKMHIKVYFKVNGVRGNDCTTKFVGHELTSDYIRRLTRRKHSKVDAVVDVTTKDGFTIRVKPMAITEKRAQSGQETAIRHAAEKVTQESAAGKDVGEFVRQLVNGDLSQEIFREARKIYPLKRVEIRRSELKGEPSGWVEEIESFPAPGESLPTESPAAEPTAEAAPAEAAAPAAAGGEEELTEEERVND
ncbi:MAG: 30S ribosomal protein S3ae [Thermoplasmatota archaeon]